MNDVKATKGMGRKPASIGHYGTQDAIWKAIRELKSFTRADLTCHINRDLKVNDETVKSYLKRLEKGGYLKVNLSAKHRGSCRIAHYILEKDTGVETPRLTKSGGEVVQGKGREQLWRAIKILKEFDWFELALAASTEDCPVAEGTAKHYCQILARAGYLLVIRQGRGKIRSRYKFLPSKNTGPRPPQVQRVKQLFDPNLDKVVWSQQGGEE